MSVLPKFIYTIAALGALLISPLQAAAQDGLARQVLTELNLARTAPRAYADHLRELRRRFQGKLYRLPDSRTLVQTSEGVAAVDEAIRVLARQKPLPPLTWSNGLAAAAAELAEEQGVSGATGHRGLKAGNMRERIERHGKWERRIGENIGYGPLDPRLMVMQLLVDDGVPGRGHRKNILNRDFGAAGVACGPHPRFGGMCVMDFAGGFRD